jgi:ABC-2 type transport system ATP-binding protein
LKILTGNLEQTSGEAYVLSINVRRKLEIKRRIGIVPEIEALPSFLTPEEFLLFIAKVRELKHETYEHWLEFFDLVQEKNTLIKDLSRGTRQKLLLINALVHEPEILFLDEPFTSLDPLYQAKLKNYFKDFVKTGKTIFLCTHVLELAEKLCTKVGIINRGKLVVVDKLEALKVESSESLEQIFYRVINSVEQVKEDA